MKLLRSRKIYYTVIYIENAGEMSKRTFMIGDTLKILWLDYDRYVTILYVIIKIEWFYSQECLKEYYRNIFS